MAKSSYIVSTKNHMIIILDTDRFIKIMQQLNKSLKRIKNFIKVYKYKEILLGSKFII